VSDQKKIGSHPNLYLHTGHKTHLRVNTHMQKSALYEQHSQSSIVS